MAPLQPSGRGGNQALAGSFCRVVPGLLIAQAASARRSFWTTSQRQGPCRSGRDARMPACCPSPVCVHYWVSTQPRSAVRGPGVQPSGVQPVQCPVIWFLVRTRLSGGWCPARPASSRLVSVRPVAAVSRQPGGGDGDTSLRRAAVTTGSSRVRVVRPRPQRLGRRPEEAWMRARCGGRVAAGGGASAADLAWGGALAGGCTRD
jgi:hypothetical protein